MPGVLQKLIRRAASRLAVESGLARHQFDGHVGGVRVLTYHGIIPDELVDQPWVPSHAVSLSRFEHQMAMLSELGPAAPLSEAVGHVHAEPGRPPMVCITFDDGLADNAELALPVLQRYGHRATFFLTTGYVGTDRVLPNDMLRLLRSAEAHDGVRIHATPLCRQVLDEPGLAKTFSQRRYLDDLLGVWQEHACRVDPLGIRAFSLMSWPQARRLKEAGMELGAHTENHVILAREDHATRRNEILGSLARIQAMTGLCDVPFSFPNGESSDYGTCDLDVLSAAGVSCAATEHPGWNDATSCRLELARNCIGLHMDDAAFLSRVYGSE